MIITLYCNAEEWERILDLEKRQKVEIADYRHLSADLTRCDLLTPAKVDLIIDYLERPDNS